jgi:hypothetical protein
VIPVRSTAPVAAKPAQPAPPPTPKPVPTPLWLSGQLPANQRGKSARQHVPARPAARGDETTTRREEASRDRRRRPRPGAGTGAGPEAAARAAGKASQDIVYTWKKNSNVKEKTTG